MARADAQPHYSPVMLEELILATEEVRGCIDSLEDRTTVPLFWITGSNRPGVFRLGGDLRIFLDCIKSNDVAGLRHYAIQCIRAIHNSIIHFNAPLVSIGLIEGDALGGGFECALTFDYLVAAENARFGFPEILFNSFPGMGACSLLTRKLGGTKVAEIIRSGRIYSAAEMKAMGLVHVVTPVGAARAAVQELVTTLKGRHAALCGFNQSMDIVSPIRFDELERVVDTWVDTIMKTSRKD